MKKTYQGSCHCGKVKLEVDADLDHVRVCDCSICRKRGALIHRVAPNCFRLITPIEELSLYQWPNGAGKTTTINLFLNFVRPDAGAAKVNGLEVAAHPLETKRDLAYIPEQVNLYQNLSGVENLEYFSALAGQDYRRAELLRFLIEAGLLEGAADQKVGTYSKGMRQKVGIAIALAKKARALLLDEPTSGLDPKAAYEFSQLLRKLAADNIAILMTTHDLFRAREVASTVGIMKQGRLVSTFPIGEFSHVDLEKLYLEHMR